MKEKRDDGALSAPGVGLPHLSDAKLRNDYIVLVVYKSIAVFWRRKDGTQYCRQYCAVVPRVGSTSTDDVARDVAEAQAHNEVGTG